jgi:hypothetical protein
MRGLRGGVEQQQQPEEEEEEGEIIANSIIGGKLLKTTKGETIGDA